MRHRYQLYVFNPSTDAYELYSDMHADSPKEVRDCYAVTVKKYGDEARHQLVKPPILTDLMTGRTYKWPKNWRAKI